MHVKDTQIYNWSVFIDALRCGDTRHLDLRNMLHVSDDWNNFCENIGKVCSLESIYLSRCPAYVVERLFQGSHNLRIVNAFDINDDSISIENVALLCDLEELHISTSQPVTLNGDLHALASLTKLHSLSLTSIKGLGDKSVHVLGQLITLKSLELGDCGDFDSIFTKTVLPQLKNLQRLRLENGIETKVCTLQVLLAVAGMEVLQQLELINFDIPGGFDEMLSLCVNITKLLIAPTYLSKSAVTNHLILSGAKQMAETLKVFTWCINYELLYVTGHYMNQCEEIIGKNTFPFDQFIPILKPVPRAFNNYVNLTIEEEPQIEILPLDMMEVILAEILPSTKFNIVKLPYCAMRKQKLIDGAE